MPVTDCTNCGACCDQQGTPPFAHIDGDSPPPELEWDIDAHADRYDKSLPCLWYDETTRQCKHYEHRPAACRFEVVPGDEYCLSFRAERGIPLPMA